MHLVSTTTMELQNEEIEILEKDSRSIARCENTFRIIEMSNRLCTIQHMTADRVVCGSFQV